LGRCAGSAKWFAKGRTHRFSARRIRCCKRKIFHFRTREVDDVWCNDHRTAFGPLLLPPTPEMTAGIAKKRFFARKDAAATI
jgi:hypothetical protein